MILTLNILLAVIVVVGIVGLLAYNIHPLRRPLKLNEVAPRGARTAAAASPYAARRTRGSQHATRTLDGARA